MDKSKLWGMLAVTPKDSRRLASGGHAKKHTPHKPKMMAPKISPDMMAKIEKNTQATPATQNVGPDTGIPDTMGQMQNAPQPAALKKGGKVGCYKKGGPVKKMGKMEKAMPPKMLKRAMGGAAKVRKEFPMTVKGGKKVMSNKV